MSTTPDDRPAAPDRPIADTDEMPLDAAVPSSARPAKAGDLTPGTMLGSLYRVIDKLGEGGMGTVYEVEHVRMQKRFAGKVLRRELCTPEHVMRFEREAMAASRIEHPNIVRVVNFDETDDGQVFLICELLSGQDLSMIVRQQAMPVREALNVAFQVASALEATHAEGIIHRDLKPENIFLTERMGETLVKVLDFGVSKVSFGADKQRLTDAGSVVGTPIYMSPENAQGQDDLDARADIYSLGVILYEMVTGTVPFFGTKALDIMFQHIHKAPEPPSVRRDELPADIDALILKALQKAPADRYHSMAEFKEELRQLGKRFGFSPVTLPEASLDGIPQFETPGPVSLTARRPRSGSIHPAILGAAAVVGLIGALFAMLAGGPETAARRCSPTPRDKFRACKERVWGDRRSLRACAFASPQQLVPRRSGPQLLHRKLIMRA